MELNEFYSGAGGEVDECSLLLRFFGEELEPDSITAMLGVDPTTCYRRGDRREGWSHVAKTGAWLLDCEQTIDTIDHQIALLFGDLTDDLGVWGTLARIYVAELKCNLFLKRWNRATILLPSTVEAIAARHLQLQFDVYTPHQVPQDQPRGH